MGRNVQDVPLSVGSDTIAAVGVLLGQTVGGNRVNDRRLQDQLAIRGASYGVYTVPLATHQDEEIDTTTHTWHRRRSRLGAS